jgi:hypothetical protein
MEQRNTETGMLKAIGNILSDVPKGAYDADYTHLKPTYCKRQKMQEAESEPIDYDLSCDGDWVDDLHECYN